MADRRIIWPLAASCAVSAIVIGAVGAAIYDASQVQANLSKMAQSTVALPNVQSTTVPLATEVIGGDLNISGGLATQSLTVTQGVSLHDVSVTGTLKSTDLTLTPSANASPIPGRLYVSTDGSLNYFDGREQLNISTAAGAVQQMGAGLTMRDGRLVNSGVLSLQGQSGNVAFSAGAGIELNGTTIINKGVKSVASNSANLLVATDGNGNLTINDTGSGLGGAIALSPSTPQIDATGNSSIWVNKTGAGNLVQLSTGTTPVSRFVVDQTGLITAGSIAYGQIIGTPSNVSSLDNATGALSLGTGLGRSGQTILNTGVVSIGGVAGAVQLGNGLSIVAGQLATTGGVGSITGTANQISVTGTSNVTLSLPQDIAVSSIPTFGGLNLTSALSIANGGTGSATSSGARSNIGAAVSGVNNDITQLSALSAITPTSSLTIGATTQGLLLQGSTTVLASTSAGVTNSLSFATPSAGAKTVVIPNASGTVAVSASGGVAIDSNGNVSCPSCLTSTGGGNPGVSSINSQTGVITITAVAPASILTSGATIAIQDASATVKGLASFDNTNLIVTNGAVTTSQNLTVTASPTFAGLTLSGALSVASGGTGLGSTPLAGALLIGNGSGYSLATLTAGTGVTVTNSAGGITIAAPSSGTCVSCANQALSNLSSVALNTSLLPGVANTIDLGSSSATFRNGYIAGVMQVSTLDAASATMLVVGGTNATSIGLNKNTVQAGGTSLTLTGGVTGTRPASPTAGMLYYDSTTNQLLQYNGTKWVGDRTASTKIVAASNSTQAAKDAADYVATGTGDQATINTALTAASGGLVYLMEGIYNESAAISVPNNTTLAGAGAGTLITVPNAQNGSYDMITNTDTSTGTQVTIRDLRIDGNKANQTSGEMNGIYLSGMGGGSGSSARIGAKILNVIARSIKQTAQGGKGYGLYLTSSSNNIVNGNYFLANATAGMSVIGSYNTVTGNTAQGNGFFGIDISSTNNTVSGNTTQGNAFAGISVPGSSNTISANLTQDSYGLYITGGTNVITGNTAQGGTYGIYLSSSFNTVAGNSTRTNSGAGIYLTGASSNSVSGNKIHDNGAASNNNGILFASSSANNSITDNDITDTSCTTTCYAINISSTASATNYLANNHHSGTAANPSTINDVGTGTIYANQPDGLGNLLNISQGGGLTIGTAVSTASLTLQGGIVATALPVPTLSSTVTNIGTAGTTIYRYQITALDGLGETTGSTIQQTTTGNATLSVTNYNTITWTPVGGARQYKVYRCTGAACTPALLATVSGNNSSFRDQAPGAPSGAVAVTNTTGGASFSGALQGSSATLSGALNVSGITSLGQLTVGGAALFKNTSDSTTAFQIQKSDASPLFVADTTNMQVTIAKLAVTGNITINGHIITGGSIPAIAAGAAACAAPTVFISGNDTSGTVSVTSGTGCAAGGVLATITFNAAFGSAPRIILTPTNANGANVKAFNGAATTTTFTIDTAAAATDATVHTFNYFAVQ